MKKAILTLIAIFIVVGVYFLFFSNKGAKPPEEYRLNVTHVSDIEESRKYGEGGTGGHCYLASTTMMLKSFDPSIEFWQVVIARGNATSFTYYFPKGKSGIKEGLEGGTEMALKAIRNMGYQPRVRLRALPMVGKSSAWGAKLIKELDGELKTYWFAPPMDEYKSVIASGIPLVAAGSPCWEDFNVIEGYSKDKLFVVVPNPDDQGKTNPKISCSIGLGLQNEVFWATPLDKQMRHAEILANMKSYAKDAPEKMLMYANYLEKGGSIVNFEIERLYFARLLAAKYLEERGYKELAAGYKKSALLFKELTKFVPLDVDENKHKGEIAKTMREIADNEKSLLNKW